ncbi:MAG: hypothetical protein AVDCRST_MAG47-941, partial [uncultured Nocardioidaceae bacterium]
GRAGPHERPRSDLGDRGAARRRRDPLPGHGSQHECPRGIDQCDPGADPGAGRVRGRGTGAADRGRARPLAAAGAPL